MCSLLVCFLPFRVLVIACQVLFSLCSFFKFSILDVFFNFDPIVSALVWLLTLGNNLSDFEKKLIHRENNFGEIFVKFLTGQEFYRNTEQLWYKTTFAHPIHFSNHRTNFAPIHFRWTSFVRKTTFMLLKFHSFLES